MDHPTPPPELEPALRQCLDQARREGTPLCLLLLEIEGFSATAMAQGAVATAQALDCLDGVLKAACRPADCSYFYQADRVAVLLSATSLAAGQRRGQQLLAALLQAGVTTRISGGVAEAGPGNWQAPQSLWQEADEQRAAASFGGGSHVFSWCYLGQLAQRSA